MTLDSLRLAPLAVLGSVALGGAFAACTTTTTKAAVLPLCDDPGPVLVRGKETGFEFCTGGPVHRPKIQDCPRFEPTAASCDEDPNQLPGCKSNAECPGQSPGSVCVKITGKPLCICSSSCITDADCDAGELCECGDPVSSCLTALCHSDAECQGGYLCVASRIDECGTPGFACQTALDECQTDVDCGQGLSCNYIHDHRRCDSFGCNQ